MAPLRLFSYILRDTPEVRVFKASEYILFMYRNKELDFSALPSDF